MSAVYGNYFDKFGSKNPIVQHLMNGYLQKLFVLIERTGNPDTILEIGCGDGSLTERMQRSFPEVRRIFALDPGFDVVAIGNKKGTNICFSCASIYELPFRPETFDLVVVPEVLEHLSDPEKGFLESIRVGRRFYIFSVPWEPVWRIGNIASGRYLRSLGNTPDHIQHWTRKQFVRFIERHLEILTVESPFPWTMILARRDDVNSEKKTGRM